MIATLAKSGTSYSVGNVREYVVRVSIQTGGPANRYCANRGQAAVATISMADLTKMDHVGIIVMHGLFLAVITALIEAENNLDTFFSQIGVRL